MPDVNNPLVLNRLPLSESAQSLSPLWVISGHRVTSASVATRYQLRTLKTVRSNQSSGLGRLNLDLLLGLNSLRLLRNLHREHALGEACFYVVGINAFRQREAALEGADVAFVEVIVLLLFLLFFLFFFTSLSYSSVFFFVFF